MANLGFIIALIYFVVIAFWVITALFYFIYVTKPPNILPGTTPQIYITIMKGIHNVLTRVFGYTFVIVTVIVVVLFFIWLILKSLPWPMNYLAEIPPLNELRDAGVFALYERIIEILMRFEGPRVVFKDVSLAISGFLKKFLIKFLDEYNPELAEKLRNAPGEKLPEPEKQEEKEANEDKQKNKDKKAMMNRMSNIIDESIERCIMNNKKNITNEMSSSEKIKTNMMNRFGEIQCQLLAIEPKVKMNITNNIV